MNRTHEAAGGSEQNPRSTEELGQPIPSRTRRRPSKISKTLRPCPNSNPSCSLLKIKRTLRLFDGSALDRVGIDHRHSYVTVAQQLLYGSA